MLTKELTERLETKLLETYEKAQKVFNRTFELPSIHWGDMGRIAGKAFLLKNAIKFSPTLYAQNVETFLNRTCPHEVAHLVTKAVYPNAKQAHGPEWRRVMQLLGVEDIGRCHSYDTSSVARQYNVKRYNYKCACDTHAMTARVHNRIINGLAKFSCRKCKSPLTYAF
jgi:SprT protein